MAETAVDNAKYRRLRANGVPHAQAVAMAAVTPTVDFSPPSSLATDLELSSALAVKAPLASPAFTGTPTKNGSPVQSQADVAGAFVSAFKPEAYGAAAAYNAGTDDTTAVQAAITAAVAAGGQVLLSRLYAIAATGVTASGPVVIRGIGGRLTSDPVNSTSPVALSGLVTASGTAVALTCAGRGTVLHDFAVINNVSAAPTAGCGIRLTAASQADVSGVSVLAFYNNIETNGVFFTVRACHFYDGVNYSVYLNNATAGYEDHGDLSISGCVIAQNYKTWACTAALRWRSGGGVKILGNKILGGAAVGNANAGGGSGGGHFSYGIDLMAGDGVNTGDFNVNGNSVSNFNVAGVRVGLENAGGTPGNIVYATFSGNNINVGLGGSAASMLIGAITGFSNNVRDVSVYGNNFNNIPSGIQVYNSTGVAIGRNTWGSVGGPLITLGASPDNGASTLGCTVAKQDIGTTAAVTVISDSRTAGSTDSAGGVEIDYDRVVRISSNGAWTTVFEVDLNSAGGFGALLQVDVNGYNANAANNSFARGAVTVSQVRALSGPTSGGTVAVTTVGTDVAAGAGSGSGAGAGAANVAIQYVTTTANTVLVQVQTTSASFPTLQGVVRARVIGGQGITAFKKS